MSSLQSGKVRTSHLSLLLGAAFAFLYLRTFLLPGTPLIAHGDETFYFQHATRILDGQMPLRDFFIFVTPGTDFLYAAIFHLLGIRMWVAQAIVIGLGLGLVCVITWIARSIFSGATVFLPGLLFLALDFNNALDATHHWYSTLFVMTAAAVLMKGRCTHRVVAAGALCGIAAVFTQTQGTLGLIAIVIFLASIKQERGAESSFVSKLLALLLPFALIVGSVLTYCIHLAGWHVVFYDLGYYILRYFPDATSHGLRAVFLQAPAYRRMSDIAGIASYIFIYLVFFVYPGGLLRLFRGRETMERGLWEKLLLVHLIGIGLLIAVITGPTYGRLCMVAPPAVLVAIWLCSGIRPIELKARRWLWILAISALVFLPVSLQLHRRTYLELPAGRTAFPGDAESERFEWLAARTRPGEAFLFDDQISFALLLKNPTAIDVITPNGSTRPEQVMAALLVLENRKPRFIFLYRGLKRLKSADDSAEPFREYVFANYHRVKTYPTGEFWQRN